MCTFVTRIGNYLRILFLTLTTRVKDDVFEVLLVNFTVKLFLEKEL